MRYLPQQRNRLTNGLAKGGAVQSVEGRRRKGNLTDHDVKSVDRV